MADNIPSPYSEIGYMFVSTSSSSSTYITLFLLENLTKKNRKIWKKNKKKSLRGCAPHPPNVTLEISVCRVS